MLEIEKLTDLHTEKSKLFAPYLLAASFQGLLKFKGHYMQNGVVFWQFSPKTEAQTLIEKFQTKTDPYIPAQDIFSAINTFWEKISLYKNKQLPGSENRNS